MGVRRGLLLALMSLLVAVAVGVGTTDVRTGTTNCGSALVPTTTPPVLRTGDVLDDEFARQSIETDCRRAITGRRLLVAVPLVAGVAAGAGARRERRRERRDRRAGTVWSTG